MHDPKIVFRELNLKVGDCFLDVGCGSGDYALCASKIVGDSGLVYAFDVSPMVIEGLLDRLTSQGVRNVKARVSDITCPLPLEDNCIDVCFIATMLHIIDLAKNGEKIFTELLRVLKTNGQLSIINCKKEEQPFGPPIHMRLSPTEVENTAKLCGFKKTNLIDLGYNYLITLKHPKNKTPP
ncbi:MAG: methyltransferase domain-containing protein [Candidatus Bathyarchaeota archaeon]|nr:methyltransferase domain-containing protein [Candidatus Bathyarchaeota archaeon]